MRPPTEQRRPVQGAASKVSGKTTVTDDTAAGPHQPTLADALRDEGASAARAATTPWVRQAIDSAIETLAATRTVPFSADDVHALLALEGIDLAQQPISGSPNALGGAFLRAAKAGIIRPAGARTSARTSRRGGLVRTWLGTGGSR